jgi:hypothetical protein
VSVLTSGPVLGSNSTAPRALSSWLGDSVNVKAYGSGARGDGVTDDTTAIQAAIDYASANNVTFVDFPAGTYIASRLTLPDQVVLRGQSMQRTVLKQKAGSNQDFVISFGFASFTGTGKWSRVEGVPGWIGLQDIQIDGNKSSQSAGNGCSFFARGLVIQNVIIRNCYGCGIYSEAGEGATIADWYELCEGDAGPLWLWDNGSHGWHLRGPHDQRISHMISALNGGDGIRIERSAGVYSGSCDIGFAHIYANTGYGMYNSATQFRTQQTIIESNFKEGLYLLASAAQFTNLQAYNNCRSSGSYQIVFDDSTVGNLIANASITQHPAGVGGIQLGGQSHIINAYIDGLTAAGVSGTGSGLYSNSTTKLCDVNLTIRNFGGTGGVGMSINNGGASQLNSFRAKVVLCKALMSPGFGNENKVDLTGYFDTSLGQQILSGAGAPNVAGQSEPWSIAIRDNSGNDWRGRTRLSHATAILLDSTTEQTFTFTHYLITTPRTESCLPFINYTGSNTAWAVQYMVVSAISSTQITVKLKLSSAAAAGQTATMCLNAEI